MSQVSVGVAGATGALGKEIVSVLQSAPWKPETLVPLASDRTTVPFVPWGDGQIAVDGLSTQSMDAFDLLFLACPPEVAAQAGAEAADEGAWVVDLTGAFADDPDVPLVVPWVNPELLSEPPARGICALPLPEVMLLGPILSALGRAGIAGDVEATIMLPASLKGRDGMDELSKQVVALFSSGTPPRKVFPDGLAFDLLPAVGEPGEDGWTSREIRVREQLRRMLGVQWPMHITLVGVPVFSGISAQISIRSARQVPADLAERVLADAGVVFPETSGVRYLPRPRRVEGQPFVHAARTRNSEDGSSLHVWAGLDNLRGAATAAVAVGGALLRHR